MTTIIPTWRGLPLPLPWSMRLRLALSWLLADVAALGWFGRTFAALPVARREVVLQRLLHHRHSGLRGVARSWKQLALLTA